MMDKRLYRSRDDRLIAGVCGGLAEYLDLDSSLVRLLWALLFFAGAVGLPLYLLAWILIPAAPRTGSQTTLADDWPELAEAGGGQPRAEDEESAEEDKRRHWAGLFLILVGGLLLLHELMPWLRLGRLWPVLLILAGLWLLVRGARRG